MNRFFFKVEFFLVVLIFAVVPIINQLAAPGVSVLNFVYPPDAFVIWAFGIAIFIQTKRYFFGEREKITPLNFAIKSGEGLKCFGFLCAISAALQLAGYFLGIESNCSEATLPNNFLQWLVFFLGTILSAFNEEVIYRAFIPESMIFFLKNKKFGGGISEITGILLFAFGHIHLSILGVLNALFCGIALRVCLKKTKTIFFSFAAHAAYNLLSFILIMKQLGEY